MTKIILINICNAAVLGLILFFDRTNPLALWTLGWVSCILFIEIGKL